MICRTNRLPWRANHYLLHIHYFQWSTGSLPSCLSTEPRSHRIIQYLGILLSSIQKKRRDSLASHSTLTAADTLLLRERPTPQGETTKGLKTLRYGFALSFAEKNIKRRTKGCRLRGLPSPKTSRKKHNPKPPPPRPDARRWSPVGAPPAQLAPRSTARKIRNKARA